MAGCVTPTEPVQPSPSSPAPRDFTVLTSQALTTTDPAAASNDTDALVATSVYQRLMRVIPESGELKPDAATDCLFTSEFVYECSLPEGMHFHNGEPVTSADVRFSIQRALRLNVAGTAISMFDALQQIETPDDLTVRFKLQFADNQFGYALATTAASIVDHTAFDPDEVLPLDGDPVGSGPYSAADTSADGAMFALFAGYIGPTAGSIQTIRLTRTTDSVSAEADLTAGKADVVWRTLDDAALERISGGTQTPSASGVVYQRWPLTGQRVTQLRWNPESKHRDNATLRKGIAVALQQDRTLNSLVPVGTAGHASAFPVGGRPKLPTIKGKRVILTLGYDPTAPGHADLARTLRDRIEAIDGLSVRVSATSKNADLVLTDRLPWVTSAVGWMQPFLDHPLEDSASTIDSLERHARTTSGAAQQQTLGQLQRQAADDLTVLPVTQTDGILVMAQGLSLGPESLGSGGELGLWGLRRG